VTRNEQQAGCVKRVKVRAGNRLTACVNLLF
jgi:hypothetical protein